MANYLLIGHPVGHSMSPFIHKRLFKESGLAEDYILEDITPEDLENHFDELSKLKGFNITIPHKVAIIPFCDELADSAERYNSVNCVAIKDGKKIGYNTDCDGFLMSVKDDYPFNGKVLLVGCGGVGRMMGIEAARHGADLTLGIIPKDLELAKNLKTEILQMLPNTKIEIKLTSEILNEKFDMMINANPVGMFPKTDAMAISEDLLKNCDSVFDAIYNPVETKLVRTAKKMGKLAKGGAYMLVLQAVKAHEIWYGGHFEKNVIDAIVNDMQEYINKNF